MATEGARCHFAEWLNTSWLLDRFTRKYARGGRPSGDVSNPRTSHDLAMKSHGAEKLTVNECLALFGRTVDDSRYVSSADSEEYLTLVAYLVARSR
jgi:hypothetical protein